MKNNFVSFAFMIIALTSYAQSDSVHLIFKRVPINGILSEYVAKMKAINVVNTIGDISPTYED